MSDGGTWLEIVVLAMIAGFIGLRLISVLGKRTGHERPTPDSYRPSAPEITLPPSRAADAAPRAAIAVPQGSDATVAPALQAIADADGGFDPARFLDGARGAYRMILEAFWAGDIRPMSGLVSDEVQEHFEAAIRERDGVQLPNRLVGIDSAAIVGAVLVGQMAEVTVRFAARIAEDAAEAAATADVWTFSRHVGSRDPNWLLIATDAEA
jgi:predicted lipid-binding transport protein (Tim44 family)